jgi:hypothetical protein
LPDGEGVSVAEIDFGRLARLRRELPALGHARLLPSSCSSDRPIGPR